LDGGALTGTLLNVATVLIGGLVGLAFGARFSDRARQTVLAGMGLFAAAIGVRMFLETQNPLYPLGGIVLGGFIGEGLRIEGGLARLGAWLETRFAGGRGESTSTFVRGFLTASLLFCVGPMTILGSIQDGLTGDFHLLAIKSVLDGFAALALASTLGVGVLFSILVILVYQGGLTLLASQAQAVLSEPMTAEMTAVGGILLLGIAIGSLLQLRPIRTGNMLPALFVTPLLVALVAWISASFS
jgi:uncharacterized membrane protein YqgA involved in biofilm formation